jgi:hypothetical protein
MMRYENNARSKAKFIISKNSLMKPSMFFISLF